MLKNSDIQLIFDLFGEYVINDVRDFVIDISARVLNGTYDSNCNKIYEETLNFNDKQRMFLQKTLAPYIVDLTIFYFLNMFDEMPHKNKIPLLLRNNSNILQFPQNNDFYFDMVARIGEKCISLVEIARPTLNGEPMPYGETKSWNARFSKYPESEIFKGMSDE